MTTRLAPRSTIDDRLRRVPRPVPLVTRTELDALTDRQRELLHELTDLFAEGFRHLTMADIARRLGCSLRTLYGIAASRDRLVLLACDASLWRAGRTARDTATTGDDTSALTAVRRYLRAASSAVQATTPAFMADLATVPGGVALADAHARYLIAVTKELLDVAVEQGEIVPIDTVVVAHAMAGVATVFIQPAVIDTLPGSPKEAVDQVVDIMVRGLQTASNPEVRP